MAQSDENNRNCLFLRNRKRKFVDFVLKVSETRRNKTKAYFNLESPFGKEISSDIFGPTLCAVICANINGTLVQKINK